MKLFKLISTTVAALLAVGALAISASAADTITANYVGPQGTETGKVTLAGIVDNADAAQKTVLVLNDNAANVVESAIVQIDQAADITTVVVGDLAAGMDAANAKLVEDYEKTSKTKADWDTLDAAWKASATYYVRVGGSGTIETGEFAVATNVEKPEAPADVPPVPEYVLAELDGIEGIGIGDAIELLKYCATLRDFNDLEMLAAELDAVTGVGIGDAIELLKYCATLIDKFPVEL